MLHFYDFIELKIVLDLLPLWDSSDHEKVMPNGTYRFQIVSLNSSHSFARTFPVSFIRQRTNQFVANYRALSRAPIDDSPD